MTSGKWPKATGLLLSAFNTLIVPKEKGIGFLFIQKNPKDYCIYPSKMFPFIPNLYGSCTRNRGVNATR